ncbi:MAG TPA: family 10 glycosylhydrolase [Candidatus Nitrosocosmicus sp.]|nr:family 10 glycosylhydrolase [Candidatus Nitrosocosmicus sp.]
MRYIRNTVFFILFITISMANIAVYAAEVNAAVTPAVFLKNGTSFQIDDVNKDRSEGKTIIYTAGYGDYTSPFGSSTHEYIVVNGIVVHDNNNGETGTYIPPNGYVISCTGNVPLTDELFVGAEIILKNVDIPVLPDMYFIAGGLTVPIDRANNLREANQINLYEASYGASTKTNPWGMEITVIDDTVTAIVDITKLNNILLDNNSPIPKAGAVISIHSGSPYYKQLHDSVKLGQKIKISADDKLYSASKVGFAAYNPRTISDNPAALDKVKGKSYDGFRGPNQLIIYDSSYGSHTGTNAYGYEVTVNAKGNITAAGGNDSKIPEGGYVISGHGDKVNWLQKYALLGASVKFAPETKELLIVFSPDSYINLAGYSIKAAQDSLDLARLQYLDVPYDKVQGLINSAQAELAGVQAQAAKGKYDNLVKAVKLIQKQADNAYFMTFEPRRAETRAVWLRPRDTSIAQIQKRLDLLKELNINTIFLETYWNGYAIYPTGSDIMQHNPMFNGMDILGVYLKEAHARGIEVHAWVENFLVDRPVAEKKPEWMAISRKGDNYYLENGVTKYYFLNPSQPEVRDFLSDLYKGLVRKYNLDGIQFDYMRYSHSGDYSNDFGYDAYTRQVFKSYTGTDPIAVKPGDTLWSSWCAFRTHLVSSYAYRVFSEVKSIKPDIMISSDVWPEYDKTLVDIYQNPKAWTAGEYINALIPMSYYLDEASVAKDITNTYPFVRGRSQLASGIATFNKVDTKVLLRQVKAVRDANVSGIAIFEFESLFNGGYSDALTLGAFSTPSTVTNRNPEQAVRMVLEDIIRKVDDIYLKYNGISPIKAEEYRKLLSAIDTSLVNNDEKAAYTLKSNIEDLMIKINTDSGLNEEVAARLNADLNTAVNITDAYISQARFMSGHLVREFQAVLTFAALKSNKPVPVKVKAVFNDDSYMYLDPSQYMIYIDGHPLTGNKGNVPMLEKAGSGASITIDILDSFSFKALDGKNRKIEFTVTNEGKVAEPVLKATKAGYTDVSLVWESPVADSEIIGYSLIRNGEEICKLSSDTYNDRNLDPASAYTYQTQGFDASGNILYISKPVTVRTKPLIQVKSE